MQFPEVRNRLSSEGYEIVMNTPEQMEQRMRGEAAKWANVIKAAGITAD